MSQERAFLTKTEREVQKRKQIEDKYTVYLTRGDVEQSRPWDIGRPEKKESRAEAKRLQLEDPMSSFLRRDSASIRGDKGRIKHRDDFSRPQESDEKVASSSSSLSQMDRLRKEKAEREARERARAESLLRNASSRFVNDLLARC